LYIFICKCSCIYHYHYHHYHHHQEQRIEEELLNLKNKKTTPIPEIPEILLKGKEKLLVRKLNDITEVDYRKRKCRLILRNLSFLATEANVANKMSKFGPLVEVCIYTYMYEYYMFVYVNVVRIIHE
jgi:hypothetical protein